jgi:hypothetical protein
MFVKIFLGLFSATFCQILPFYSLQFFSAINNFLGPLLSYLAENSAIWHQCKIQPAANQCCQVGPSSQRLSSDRTGEIGVHESGLMHRKGTNVGSAQNRITYAVTSGCH